MHMEAERREGVNFNFSLSCQWDMLQVGPCVARSMDTEHCLGTIIIMIHLSTVAEETQK